MPDWSSSAEIQKDGTIFVKLLHALFGLYIWEWFVSLDFDWEFISGKKKFRWPMIFYFANRYSLFFAMIGVMIAFNITSEIDCQALYTFNQVSGDAAVGLASINLSIRTMAVWSQDKYITIFLILIILGHWSLILQGILVRAKWVPGVGCVLTSTNNTLLAATFIYSMAFDFIVLLLNAYKLGSFPRIRVSREKGGEQTMLGAVIGSMGGGRLANMIFQDGLIYFIIAFIANLLATIFMLLDLNSVMSVFFNAPAAVTCTIVACRVVRRLSNFTHQPASIFVTTTIPGIQNGCGLPNLASIKVENAHVHVQRVVLNPAKDSMNTTDTMDSGSDYLDYDDADKHGLPPAPPSSDGSDTNTRVELDADVEATAGLH